MSVPKPRRPVGWPPSALLRSCRKMSADEPELGSQAGRQQLHVEQIGQAAVLVKRQARQQRGRTPGLPPQLFRKVVHRGRRSMAKLFVMLAGKAREVGVGAPDVL